MRLIPQVLALVAFGGTALTAQDLTAIRVGRLVDVERGEVRANQVILIRGDLIEAVQPGSQPIPRGARVAVLLDQPAYLDFARNPIINLDIPGYASYRPGMPFFRGAEPVAAYFRDHDIRYLAFVRGDRSRYFFRRDYCLARVMWDIEIWQIMGAYVIDCLDNFTELADHYPRRFERDGVVMLDLAAPGGAP